MKTLFYEMKKSWLKLPMLFILVLLLVLNIYRFCDLYRYSGRWGGEDMRYIEKAYFDIYNETLSGEITPEKTKYVKENAERYSDEVSSGDFSTEFDESRLAGYAYSDYMLFQNFLVPELEYAVTYPNISNKIAARADKNISFFTDTGNKKEVLKNRLIYDLYSGRQIKNYYLTEWAEIYFQYEFSSLMIMIMLILGLSSVFSSEYESGMNVLIAAGGQTRKTASSKLISAAIYVFILTLIFTAADLLTINFLSPIDGMCAPFYSAKLFKTSPYNNSFISAILICMALKYFVFFVISEFIMLISYITKNTIMSTVVSFALIIILIIAADGTTSILNPINMLSTHKLLMNFECITVFGKAVLSIYAAVIFYLIISMVLAFFIKQITSKSERGSKNVKIRTKKAVC